MKYVIIGNSTAAIGTVEGIRNIDKKGEIVIISDEKFHTYSRPLISYLLNGKTDLERMKYRANDFYEKNNVTTMFSKRVIKIDSVAKKVILDNKEEVSFDKLMVATGSRPFIPPMKGLETVSNKFSFMTLDDALSLQEAITENSRILVVGAGLIGLKCVEGIAGKVKEITVIDLADRILPSILDAEGAALVQEKIQEKDVKFVLGASVAEFEKNKAITSKGDVLYFDILVLAVGVRPNTELVKDAGGKVEKGIITDNKQQTSLKDVYSSGDCVESFDITIDSSRILALLPNAYMQGHTAGINMAGGENEYNNAVPMNAIGFFGYHIITAGSYIGECYKVAEKDNLKKLFTKDDRLKGFIMMGDVQRAGIYTSLIRERKPLSEIDFELIKDRPQLIAFSQNDRKQKLSREV
jgi:NAD(P)H-nitrite reductase large subunit